VAPAGWQELPGTFEASGDAETARLERRLEYVLRQLEWRIMEADRLRAQIDETQAQIDETHAQLDTLRQQLDVQSRETDAWRQEFEAVMATKTMRAARMPRTLYARIRGGSRL
jgi:chromosome segregation ATPase